MCEPNVRDYDFFFVINAFSNSMSIVYLFQIHIIKWLNTNLLTPYSVKKGSEFSKGLVQIRHTFLSSFWRKINIIVNIHVEFSPKDKLSNKNLEYCKTYLMQIANKLKIHLDFIVFSLLMALVKVGD